MNLRGSGSWCHVLVRRFSTFSTTSRTSGSLFLQKAVVECRGEVPYGSREYVLVLPLSKTETTERPVLASLRAHRNILFGARLMDEKLRSRLHKLNDNHFYTLTNTCSALVEAALVDAGRTGEQPQALSTLHGLCDWVQTHVLPPPLNDSDDNNDNNHGKSESESQLLRSKVSLTIPSLWETFTENEQEAVRAIATGVPRPGHSVVGQGTYQDGAAAWEKIARLFVEQTTSPTTTAITTAFEAPLLESPSSTLLSSTPLPPTTMMMSHDEPQLYVSQGGVLVQIESLADTKPAYLKSAGGAMARFVFM